jgi:kinesin family protein C1
MDGYKVCIFSYGQTGSGKTYTMEGDIKSEEHKGMIPRAVTEIFNSIQEYKTYGWDFRISCSF